MQQVRLGRMRYLDEATTMPKVTKQMLIRILKYFIPYWKRTLTSVVIILLSSVLGLIPPFIVKNIVDIALPQKNLKLLGVYILISIVSNVVLGLLQVWQNYLNTWTSKNIIFNMKNEMYKHLQSMSLEFFSSASPGEIITRVTSDIDGVEGTYNTTLTNGVSNIFTLVTTLAALFSMNWKLTIVSMLIVPIFVAPTRKVGKLRWQIARKSQEKLGELNQIIQETFSISGSILTKIFTKEKKEYESFKEINENSIKLQIKETMAGRWFFMVIGTLAAVGPLIIYFYGGYLFIHGEITIGSILTFVALLGRLYGPVNQLSNIHVDVTRSLALFQRIFDYFDKKQEIVDKPNAEVMKPIAGNVEFNHVGFSYNRTIKALEDISFSVSPGTMVALVGASGAGKTTITNLIPRLYDVCEGSIKIDGTDIRDVTLESLRRQIGIVMQEPYLFNSTIEDNLKYGKEDASEKEMINACKASYIHDFIMSLPEGYKTVVGNRGIKLSGGEKQRISIARVILKNPRIIILDEATSALDSVSEAYIQKAMVPLLKGRTSFVIAHRLSTVLAADQIFVMDKGHIVERGAHQELLEQNGVYKNLYDIQFKTQAKLEGAVTSDSILKSS